MHLKSLDGVSFQNKVWCPRWWVDVRVAGKEHRVRNTGKTGSYPFLYYIIPYSALNADPPRAVKGFGEDSPNLGFHLWKRGKIINRGLCLPGPPGGVNGRPLRHQLYCVPGGGFLASHRPLPSAGRESWVPHRAFLRPSLTRLDLWGWGGCRLEVGDTSQPLTQVLLRGLIIPILGLLTLLVGIRSGISGGCPRLLALWSGYRLELSTPRGPLHRLRRGVPSPAFSTLRHASGLRAGTCTVNHSLICFHWQAYVSLGWLEYSSRVSFQLLGLFLLSAD